VDLLDETPSMAMKIGVISDTHLKSPNALLRNIVKDFFADTDMILHAGDVVSIEVLEAFQGHKLVAVAGNTDGAEIRERFPEKQVLELGGFRIGLIHGWGPPFGLAKRAATCFDDIHCLVFGHSHWACNRRNREGILLFNPGSFSSSLFSVWRRSIGILTLDKGISAEIVRL
jgi:uncharacterized protein